jgi:3-deoxy-manno-octulosonate cytidylyltransferase (CMP-KDO synthetase)
MNKKLKILGLIPARYGSTRFPGKPLALIAGKTLIQRTYENAKLCHSLDDIAVATDDERIFEHVKGFGGKVVMTSPECPTGTERLAEAVRKYDLFSDYGIIINVQGDEPLLQSKVIESVIDKLVEDELAAMSTAVIKLTSKEEAANYSVVKCVMDQKGNALYFSRTLIPNGHSGEWHPKTTYYKHLGIYGYRREFLFHYAELKPTPLQLSEDLEQLKVLEHGYKIKVAIVDSISLGVDKPEDIKKIEHLL